MIRVTVIICTYNRQNYIEECLSHFLNQTFPLRDFEILIIDNNSTDQTATYCKEFIEQNNSLNIRYLFEEAIGLSHARNRGIAEAQGEVVLFLDDDAFAEKEYISNTVKWFDQISDMVAAGGKIIPIFESGKKPKWFTKHLLPLVAAIDLGDKLIKFPSSKFPIGANMLFRKSVFNKIGLFNVNLGRSGTNLLGGEEKDIFDRLKGEKVYYLPDVKVNHIVPEKRMSIEYIKKQALGVGKSERIRLANSLYSKKFYALCWEIIKFLGSLVLCMYYIFMGRAEGGMFLLRFRYWVWQGYFNNNIGF
jgi:glycosyltransferase involved in cell wall biosynthesis